MKNMFALDENFWDRQACEALMEYVSASAKLKHGISPINEKDWRLAGAALVHSLERLGCSVEEAATVLGAIDRKIDRSALYDFEIRGKFWLPMDFRIAEYAFNAANDVIHPSPLH